MANRDIITVGCSAGGVEALTQLVSRLPADFRASLLVVLHVPSRGGSVLPKILSNAGPLPAVHAQGGEAIERGRIYVAPPDVHLVIRSGRLAVEQGPRQNGHRPAIDATFRSAALAFGQRVVGVVLSGTRDDGSAGLVAVRRAGGLAVVQHPSDASFPDMPRNAIETAGADHVLPVAEIAPLLVQLASQEVIEVPTPKGTSDATIAPSGARAAVARSVFVCPDCRGPLSELREFDVLRFECRVGHAFTPASLMAKEDEAVEAALWSAVNALEERAELSRRMALRAHERGHQGSADRFEAQAEDSEQSVATLRKILFTGMKPATSDDE